MQIKAQLEKHGEDIAENEAMLTNTGNKVERLEGDIEAVDKATGNRFLDEEILGTKLFNKVEDSLNGFSKAKEQNEGGACKLTEYHHFLDSLSHGRPPVTHSGTSGGVPG
ncbi:hypothetical protein NW768_007111 [Fusarium equiseti]|uniref:Uncharacterized protein n=1 Tax=Fusarium equiseti TaxID=61235 RepID=A0ABQ8RA73_FUSEQ|nr:hypothetical protein NW768_007111 [Fusarium equiseti]